MPSNAAQQRRAIRSRIKFLIRAYHLALLRLEMPARLQETIDQFPSDSERGGHPDRLGQPISLQVKTHW
jgi:hypothetical protein